MQMKVAVCVSGRGSNFTALADRLGPDGPAMIGLVLSDRAAPALDLASERGIPAYRLLDPADPAEWMKRLAEHKIEFIVLAGYLKLVPGPVIEAYRDRVLNIHPSLLPAFGGPGMYGIRVHRAVLASGATESGATVHLVDEVYDRGRILAQGRVPVLPGDTPEQLAARVLTVEHQLLPEVVIATIGAAVPQSP